MGEVFFWCEVKLFSHWGGVFLMWSPSVFSWGSCLSGTKWSCSFQGKMFFWYKVKVLFWYKVKLLCHGGGGFFFGFFVQSECFLMEEGFFWGKVKLLSFVGGVFLVQSEAVVFCGRCFSGAKWSCSLFGEVSFLWYCGVVSLNVCYHLFTRLSVCVFVCVCVGGGGVCVCVWGVVVVVCTCMWGGGGYLQ